MWTAARSRSVTRSFWRMARGLPAPRGSNAKPYASAECGFVGFISWVRGAKVEHDAMVLHLARVETFGLRQKGDVFNRVMESKTGATDPLARRPAPHHTWMIDPNPLFQPLMPLEIRHRFSLSLERAPGFRLSTSITPMAVVLESRGIR